MKIKRVTVTLVEEDWNKLDMLRSYFERVTGKDHLSDEVVLALCFDMYFNAMLQNDETLRLVAMPIVEA